MSIVIRDARVVTMAGVGPRRGGALRELGVIERGDVVVQGGVIAGRGVTGSVEAPRGAVEIEAAGRVLMPGFVDCHTHACWAGSRVDEWERKLRGQSYLEILKAGGGIMATVRAVQGTTQEELERGLEARLGDFLRNGTTTVEVKSGYGLTTADELKMLRAIAACGKRFVGMVSATALLGHAVDRGEAGFVERVIGETLPSVLGAFPGITVDAFCEEGAWSRGECVRLFEEVGRLGRELGAQGWTPPSERGGTQRESDTPLSERRGTQSQGHTPASERRGTRGGIRVHADQFNSLGMVGEAVRLGAVSVDHLEATTREDIELLAKSGTFGVGLPICGMHLDGRYANLRLLVDAGGLVAIATNCNPGSAPCTSMPLAIAAAVRHCGLTSAEAIAAATVNAAAVLRLGDRGQIEVGMRADLILLKHTDPRALAYELGGNPVDLVVCGGEVVASRHS